MTDTDKNIDNETEKEKETVIPEDEGIEEVVGSTSFWTFIPAILLVLAFAGGIIYFATEVRPEFFKGVLESIRKEQTVETEETEETEETVEEAKNEFPKKMYVNSEDGLILRDGPSKEDNEIYVLIYGQEIEVDNIENGWAHTTVEGHTGWCSAEYLSEKKDE